MRLAATLLGCAASLHVASIVASLLVLHAIVSSSAGGPVSSEQVFEVLDRLGLTWILYVGVAAQSAFFVLSVLGARTAWEHRNGAAVPMIAAGAVAIVISLLILGGVIGAAGGVLSVIGGALSLPQRPMRYTA
ncbi:MAG TPA: hypothetical protein VJ400_07175 [Thermoplasmata archaeon]|nr:hypothetical protein [Thermoplasmata archaeon]